MILAIALVFVIRFLRTGESMVLKMMGESMDDMGHDHDAMEQHEGHGMTQEAH